MLLGSPATPIKKKETADMCAQIVIEVLNGKGYNFPMLVAAPPIAYFAASLQAQGESYTSLSIGKLLKNPANGFLMVRNSETQGFHVMAFTREADGIAIHEGCNGEIKPYIVPTGTSAIEFERLFSYTFPKYVINTIYTLGPPPGGGKRRTRKNKKSRRKTRKHRR